MQVAGPRLALVLAQTNKLQSWLLSCGGQIVCVRKSLVIQCQSMLGLRHAELVGEVRETRAKLAT